MIKNFLWIIFLITITQLIAQEKISSFQEGKISMDNINDITVLDMNNNKIKLSDYNGKVLMIVNVASECGYTKQYAGLQKIYEKYNPKGFEILAFPCNDFGGQEPGTNEQIQNFCSSKFGVTFKLFDKIKVLGDERSPLYDRLINNNVTENGDVKWNFEKFIISKDGKIVARFRTKVEPASDEVISAIEGELKK
ncbi:MAG: glutathione peroxidase [Ignavibacteriaceae bacterium]|nr:MAG: glutathione peroxidase [Ignavibacteriota bacterium]GJQ43570.1 MAG: glutathione peroxidase [Ignavibacteriaceae bacterium]